MVQHSGAAFFGWRACCACALLCAAVLRCAALCCAASAAAVAWAAPQPARLDTPFPHGRSAVAPCPCPARSPASILATQAAGCPFPAPSVLRAQPTAAHLRPLNQPLAPRACKPLFPAYAADLSDASIVANNAVGKLVMQQAGFNNIATPQKYGARVCQWWWWSADEGVRRGADGTEGGRGTH